MIWQLNNSIISNMICFRNGSKYIIVDNIYFVDCSSKYIKMDRINKTIQINITKPYCDLMTIII